MRQTATYPIDDLDFWKKQLLYWVAANDYGAYLDSNEYPNAAWECLAAAGAETVLEANVGNAFEQLDRFQSQEKDWLFGFFGYDLKNEVEQLSSQNFDGIGLPDLFFFKPEIVVSIKPAITNGTAYLLEIQTLRTSPATIFSYLSNTIFPLTFENPANVELKARIPKNEYLEIVEIIRQHIITGDVYELNFCQEFFAEQVTIDPVRVFERLNKIGKAPFTTFLRKQKHYLLSASPERFLKKTGQKLLTQPIKGTRRRGINSKEDEKIRLELSSSEKDRSENVMIVDLVRNDFSRNCVPGSVIVEELCAIYSFATVHQMISTVSGILPEHISGLNALRDAFPMGSMTGAPKVMAMELIEKYERSRRGLYSGAVGYISPEGDFDFNVVIRSILYNALTGYVSAQVGGAIVFDSVPEQEYEECLVKADGMLRALALP